MGLMKLFQKMYYIFFHGFLVIPKGPSLDGCFWTPWSENFVRFTELLQLVKQDHKRTGRVIWTERATTNMNSVQSASTQFAIIAMLLAAMIILATISEANALIVSPILPGNAQINAAQMFRSTCHSWNGRFFLRCTTGGKEASNKPRCAPPKTCPSDGKGKKNCSGCPGAGGKGCKGKCIGEN